VSLKMLSPQGRKSVLEVKTGSAVSQYILAKDEDNVQVSIFTDNTIETVNDSKEQVGTHSYTKSISSFEFVSEKVVMSRLKQSIERHKDLHPLDVEAVRDASVKNKLSNIVRNQNMFLYNKAVTKIRNRQLESIPNRDSEAKRCLNIHVMRKNNVEARNKTQEATYLIEEKYKLREKMKDFYVDNPDIELSNELSVMPKSPMRENPLVSDRLAKVGGLHMKLRRVKKKEGSQGSQGSMELLTTWMNSNSSGIMFPDFVDPVLKIKKPLKKMTRVAEL